MSEDDKNAGYISQDAMQKVIKKLSTHKGVKGICICDSYGLPLQSNLDPDHAESISAQAGSLVGKIKLVSTEIAGELPSSVRIESTINDIEIIPDFETEITIVALIEKPERAAAVAAADGQPKSLKKPRSE